jgi:outer membrane protein OmpA-like peptidoglycan-associated protein
MALISEDYDVFDDQPTAFRRWLLPALIISILLHVILFMGANRLGVEPLSEAYFDRIVPRTFLLERVEIDPQLLEPDLADEKQAASSPVAVKAPEDQISFEHMMADVTASPAAPATDNPILTDKPKVDPTSLAQTIQSAEREGAQSVIEDLSAIREELILDKPQESGRPLLELGNLDVDSGAPTRSLVGPASGGTTPGFSNLDALLAHTGPLSPETAPILMPADLLFDYDSYSLREQAVSSLRKLGILVQKNPGSNFVIEGHTDSFGSDDYNLQLSRLRAEAVKAWLVQAMNIPPGRVRTRGLGKSRLIAPASGSIEEQQLNRRVEIIIRAR